MAPVSLKMRNSNAAEQTPLKRRAPAPRKACGPGLCTRGLLSVFCLVVLTLTGCLVGPNYKRPIVNTPTTYRGLTDTEAASVTPASLGDQKWWEVFQDQQLQQLIRTALQQNYDVRIAAERVLEAQAQLGITRANQYPSVSVNGTGASLRNPATGPIPSYTYNYGRVAGNATWEPDFWGMFRRETEAARAQLLASEWARQEVNATLVANVASAYFQLRELDLELDISQKALASRKESLDLTKTLEEHGINSILDVRQAEQLVYTAAAEIAALPDNPELGVGCGGALPRASARTCSRDRGKQLMRYGNSIGVVAFSATLLMAIANAAAHDEAKYPDLRGQWTAVGGSVKYVPDKPRGLGQEAPLTPEYQAIFEAPQGRGGRWPRH